MAYLDTVPGLAAPGSAVPGQALATVTSGFTIPLPRFKISLTGTRSKRFGAATPGLVIPGSVVPGQPTVISGSGFVAVLPRLKVSLTGYSKRFGVAVPGLAVPGITVPGMLTGVSFHAGGFVITLPRLQVSLTGNAALPGQHNGPLVITLPGLSVHIGLARYQFTGPFAVSYLQYYDPAAFKTLSPSPGQGFNAITLVSGLPPAYATLSIPPHGGWWAVNGQIYFLPAPRRERIPGSGFSIHDEWCPKCYRRHWEAGCAEVEINLPQVPEHPGVVRSLETVGGFSIHDRWCAEHGVLHGKCV